MRDARIALDGDTDYKTTLTGLKDEVSGKLWRSLEVLWAAVGLILLFVCVNLSNLLLARAATRSKEFSLRMALVGVSLGTIASHAVARAISSTLFDTEPGDPAIFLIMIASLTAVAFVAGYLPARRASRVEPIVALRGN